MAKIRQQPPPPPQPMWPWGGPRAVRERLVDRGQLGKKGVGKKGDPKNPALASAALLDFIGPAHSADELRLPMPLPPSGHDADLANLLDRSSLSSVASRLEEHGMATLDRALGSVKAAPERLDRLKALLSREADLLALVRGVSQEMSEIERRRMAETVQEGY